MYHESTKTRQRNHNKTKHNTIVRIFYRMNHYVVTRKVEYWIFTDMDE